MVSKFASYEKVVDSSRKVEELELPDPPPPPPPPIAASPPIPAITGILDEEASLVYMSSSFSISTISVFSDFLLYTRVTP